MWRVLAKYQRGGSKLLDVVNESSLNSLHFLEVGHSQQIDFQWGAFGGRLHRRSIPRAKRGCQGRHSGPPGSED